MAYENLKRIRDVLRANPDGVIPEVDVAFNMNYENLPSDYGSPRSVDFKGCGTVACIYGLAEIMMGRPHEPLSYEIGRLSPKAKPVVAWLGIEYEDVAYELFMPSTRPNYSLITPAEAADAIDRVIEGKAPWA